MHTARDLESVDGHVDETGGLEHLLEVPAVKVSVSAGFGDGETESAHVTAEHGVVGDRVIVAVEFVEGVFYMEEEVFSWGSGGGDWRGNATNRKSQPIRRERCGRTFA